MIYYHVDVFSKGPLTGNGLTVLICDTMPSAEIMQKIAREMKQFETIFLCRRAGLEYDARIFTIDEELKFAGHPILGAAASVCAQNTFCMAEGVDSAPGKTEPADKKSVENEVVFHLPNKDIPVSCRCKTDGKEYECIMDQGEAEVIGVISKDDISELIEPVHIKAEDLDPEHPLEVCSTGLPYLIIPVVRGIENAGIFANDYEERLSKYGAKFAYFLDTKNIEGRTFDNNGLEDVATGSAAGPGGDYLVRHGICRQGEREIIHQGRFLGRPSEIAFCKDANGRMLVSGGVSILARGTFEI